MPVIFSQALIFLLFCLLVSLFLGVKLASAVGVEKMVAYNAAGLLITTFLIIAVQNNSFFLRQSVSHP